MQVRVNAVSKIPVNIICRAVDCEKYNTCLLKYRVDSKFCKRKGK